MCNSGINVINIAQLFVLEDVFDRHTRVEFWKHERSMPLILIVARLDKTLSESGGERES